MFFVERCVVSSCVPPCPRGPPALSRAVAPAPPDARVRPTTTVPLLPSLLINRALNCIVWRVPWA